MAELLRIGYGKEAVSVYRTDGVSSLFAAEIGMTARGAAFAPSYTEGDNTVVVATDSMKNFIQITALEYGDDSLEGFLELLGAPLPRHVRPGRADRAHGPGGAVRAPDASSRSRRSAATTPSRSSRSAGRDAGAPLPAARGFG